MTGQQARTKTIYFIRHAESLENLKHQSIHRVIADIKSASLPDPQDVVSVVELLDIRSHVDTPVSPKGKRQIRNVAQQLRQANFVLDSQISLVVHSPLQRAQETAEGLLECRASKCQAPSVQRVVQLDSLRERTPDEIWIPWRKAEYTARRQDFLFWLMDQPEPVIAVVGHSEYFRSLLHLPFKFGHCDVWRAEFRPYTRQKFFGLERLYRPQLRRNSMQSIKSLDDEDEAEYESLECGSKDGLKQASDDIGGTEDNKENETNGVERGGGIRMTDMFWQFRRNSM